MPGIPTIVAFRTLRWAQDDTLRIGEKSSPADVRPTNLAFGNDHLVVIAGIEGRKVFGTVDTGAQTTDLYSEAVFS